jgi:hypothetical protein
VPPRPAAYGSPAARRGFGSVWFGEFPGFGAAWLVQIRLQIVETVVDIAI